MGVKSDMYDRLERLYSDGELTLPGLDRAVSKGWITEEEKERIINGNLKL